MKITIDVDDQTWWQLAEIADAHNIRVPDVAAKAVRAAVAAGVKPRRHGPYRHHRPITDEAKRVEIRRLWSLNRSLHEIARATGTTHMTIGATLHDMGINTNRKAAA